MDEGGVAESDTARRGVVAGEVPVTGMVGTGVVQTFDALEDQFDRCLHSLRAKHLHNLRIDLLDAERCIDIAHIVLWFRVWSVGRFALAVGVSNNLFHSLLFDKGDGGAEGAELLEARHVDAVVVGVADLWRAADHHDLLGMQTVENLEDALAEGGATHDTVVDDDEVVFIRTKRTVTDIIDVSCEVVALGTVRNKSAGGA